MSKDGLVKISKLEHNAIYGRKFMNEFNINKDKGKVKFHTKPTQVNRKNPILVIDCYPVVRRWMYELDNGYFILFSVYDDTRSEAVVANYSSNYETRSCRFCYGLQQIFGFGYVEIGERD